MIDYQRKLGCDVIVRMIFDLFYPFNIVFGGVNDGVETETWQVKTENVIEENNLIKKSVISTPDGILTQDFVRIRQNKGIYVYCLTISPLHLKGTWILP